MKDIKNIPNDLKKELKEQGIININNNINQGLQTAADAAWIG